MRKILLCLLFVTNSVFAMTEKELKEKVDFAKLAYRCSSLNKWAQDFNESNRLSALGMSNLIEHSSLIASLLKNDSKEMTLTEEQKKHFNDEFILGYFVGSISQKEEDIVEREVFMEFPKLDSKEKAIKLIEENNCKFIR